MCYCARMTIRRHLRNTQGLQRVGAGIRGARGDWQQNIRLPGSAAIRVVPNLPVGQIRLLLKTHLKKELQGFKK